MWRCIIREKGIKTAQKCNFSCHMLIKLEKFDECHLQLVGMQNGATPMKGIWQYLPKLQTSLPLDPTIPLAGISHTDPLACIQNGKCTCYSFK